MTDSESAAAKGAPNGEPTAEGGLDDRIADIRQQRDLALQSGDRETAEEFDALERELHDAGAQLAAADIGELGGDGTVELADAAHAPLTRDEVSGVFAFLDEVDPDATVTLRAEWGGDAAANLGYAHLWFTTQYTQDERDSMVVTPGLVRMAARMGRQLAAGGRASNEVRRQSGGEGDGAAGPRRDPAEFRHRRQAAQRSGDYRLAQELDEQERAAWARLHGDTPIVGRAGRNL